MAGPGITEADLGMAESLAQLMARLQRPGLKDTTFGSLTRLKKELEIQLGLSPAARKGLRAPDPDTEKRGKAEALLSDD